MMNAGKQRMVAFYQAAPKRKANDVGVELVPLADASDEFDLTVPPAVKVVYVTHPRDTRKLIPFADYDRRVAEDKLDEALRIFTSLGAARIVATATKDDSSRLELNVGKRKVGLRLGGEKSSGLKLEFDVRGSGNKPVDPRPLRYPEEPMFNAVCESVLRLGNQRASIKIVRSSSFGLDGDLAVRLKRAGFNLGVGAKKSLSDVFTIDAAFSPEAVEELDAVVQAARPEVLDGARVPGLRRARRKSS